MYAVGSAAPESSFSLMALGLLFGVLLAIVGLAAVALLVAVYFLRRETSATRDLTLRTLARNTAAINLLRNETTLALSRMDVDRAHEAAQQLQISARSLGSIVGRLSKILFTQPGMDETVDPFGVPNSGVFPSSYAPGPLDDEARQDAAQIDQWQARQHGARESWDFSHPPRSTAPQPVTTATDEFARYRGEQQAKQAAAAGDTSQPLAVLPDLNDAHDLDAEQGLDASELAGRRVPGFGGEGER